MIFEPKVETIDTFVFWQKREKRQVFMNFDEIDTCKNKVKLYSLLHAKCQQFAEGDILNLKVFSNSGNFPMKPFSNNQILTIKLTFYIFELTKGLKNSKTLNCPFLKK